MAGTAENFTYPPVYQIAGSASYVTGSNTLRGRRAVALRTVPRQHERQRRSDSALSQRRARLGHRLQHAATQPGAAERRPWRLGAGLVDAEAVDAESGCALRVLQRLDQCDGGRGRPLRGIPDVSGADDIPNWFNIAPRFGVVYDLRGDAKTAIRFGVNRYNTTYAVTPPRRTIRWR